MSPGTHRPIIGATVLLVRYIKCQVELRQSFAQAVADRLMSLATKLTRCSLAIHTYNPLVTLKFPNRKQALWNQCYSPA